MSAGTHDSVTIDAAPDAVAAVIADVEAYPRWSPDIENVRILSDAPDGRPVEVGVSVSAGPVQDSAVLRYSWDLDADGVGAVSWVLVRSSMLRSLSGRYVLEREGTGTRVTYDLDLETAVPVPGILRRRAEKVIVTNALDGLRRRVEG